MDKSRKRFIVVMIDRFTKWTRAIPVSRIAKPQVAIMVLGNWILLYGIPNVILTNIGKQFTAKIFVLMCAALDAKLVPTTEYHLQCNGQEERFNRTMVAKLRHCMD